MAHPTPTGFFSLPIEVNLANLEATVDVRLQVANDSVQIGGDVGGTPTLIGAGTLVGSIATTQVGLDTRAFNYVFDGTDWERWEGAAPAATFPTTNISSFTNNFLYAFDGTNFIRLEGGAGNGTETTEFNSINTRSFVYGLDSATSNQRPVQSTNSATGYGLADIGLETQSLIYGLGPSGLVQVAVNASGELLTSTDPSSTIDQSHISVSTTATSIVASNTSRRSVTIKNISTSDVYIGASDVVTTDGNALGGYILRPDDPLTIDSTAEVFGRVASGTANVAVLEELV